MSESGRMILSFAAVFPPTTASQALERGCTNVKTYIIRITDDALESLVLAAVEAYCFGSGGPGHYEQVETYGYLWGYRKLQGDQCITFITKVSVSISARRGCNFVVPNQRAMLLKDNFVAKWSPQLSFLGEFHSHPFEDRKSVRRSRGYELSEQDIDSLYADDQLWLRAGNMPVMLVITVCRLSRVVATWSAQPRSNVFSFSVGEYRFWLSAIIGDLDPYGARSSTENRRSQLKFDLDSRFFNGSREQLGG